jgi:hypothetical protein
MATSFMWVASDRGDDSFSEKKVISDSTAHAVRTRMRGVGELEVQKILKSVASSRRNQDPPDTSVIKSIGTVIFPK